MTILLLVSTVIAVGYIIYADVRTDGVPESLSATYYTLGSKGWIFQLAMALTGMTLMPVWLTLSEESHRWLAFLACTGLVFVAFAPAFRLKLEGAVHYSFAVICCVSAVLWQIGEGLWDVTLFFAFICFTLYLQFKKYMWWLEVAVIGSLFANLWRVV